MLLTIFGIILMIPGFIASKVFLLWLSEGGKLYIDITLSLALLIPVGLLIIFFALRKKYLLLIDLDKGRRKILFKGKLNKDEFHKFIENARQSGYNIQVLENIA